jgi:methionine-rich copper-binding protein CopC
MRLRQVTAILGAIFLVFAASPASAHTALVSSSPQKDSVVASLPQLISITFAEDLVVIGNSNSVSVLDSTGEEVSFGEISVLGPTLSKQLTPSDKTGKFKVEYRAVASDGHVINGDFTFTVEEVLVTTSETKADPISSEPLESKNKISVYLILSITAIVGGLLVLVFIWKRQAK